MIATETTTTDAWVRLRRGHAVAVKTLNARLVRSHGLTISEYETLLLLARAPTGESRPTDLARELGLTASGVTRLLDRLEAAGLVSRRVCSADARVTYAVLTDAGRERLRESSRSHDAAIAELFGDRYTPAELDQLGDLLGRLPKRPAACAVVE